ncbi:MAG: hypothetical protein GY816_00220 [Cytophagales bacterium]|nr:hypothetical protein [Cytophagales bacterium]
MNYKQVLVEGLDLEDTRSESPGRDHSLDRGHFPTTMGSAFEMLSERKRLEKIGKIIPQHNHVVVRKQ